MKDRIYHISDVLNEEYLRFPLGLLAEPKYRDMSLEAKMIYSLLLNRLTLSQRNGWINDNGEVYLIYTREDAAETLNLSYKKTIAAFKELIAADLLLEQRQGRGYPNLLYVLKMVVTDEKAEEFSDEFSGESDEKEPANPDKMQTCQNGISRTAEMAHQELPKQHIKICQNGTSRTADTEYLDMPNRHTRKNNNINLDNINLEIENLKEENLFDCVLRAHEGKTDFELESILRQCELEIFSAEMTEFFKTVITRMYYSEEFKVGKSVLPQREIRKLLKRLSGDHLIELTMRLKRNEDKVTRPIEYICSMLANVLSEGVGSLVLSLPKNYVSDDMLYDTEEGC